MADTRASIRIRRADQNDAEKVARCRDSCRRAARMLSDNPPPDTFLGRKTQEPFPNAGGKERATPSTSREKSDEGHAG